MVEAFAAVIVLPAVPSATETLLDNVRTPEIPAGAVETFVESMTAVIAV
jgi:hypothetical protein